MSAIPVKALSITEKNGDIASFKIARPDTDIVIITDAGMVMRMSLDQINVLGRVTQGVRLINLKDGHTVATLSLVDKEKEEELSTSEESQQSVILGNNPEIVESHHGDVAVLHYDCHNRVQAFFLIHFAPSRPSLSLLYQKISKMAIVLGGSARFVACFFCVDMV